MLRTFTLWVQMTTGQLLLADISSPLFQMYLLFFMLLLLSLKVRKLGGVGKEKCLNFDIRPGAIFVHAYNSN